MPNPHGIGLREKIIKYRVFHVILHQEQGCCEHVLGLMTAQRASMSPQDWAQITFRSEMHSNGFYNEPGGQSENKQNQDMEI